MQGYWLNFIKTGNPNGADLPEWEMRTESQKELLQLDEQVQMTEDPYTEIYKLLDLYQDSLSE
jgi:para-nitrobenzyl esterase